MLKEVLMPKLGQTVEEATIETWHKAEGDEVAKGDVLLEITTDKATLEVESYFQGTVQKLVYTAGETVPVNCVIAFIGDEAVSDDRVVEVKAAAAAMAAAEPAPKPEAAPAAQPAAPAAPAAQPAVAQPAVAAAPASVAVAVPPPSGRLFASPRARRVADERKVALQLLAGSGPNGRIVEADVLNHAEQIDALRVSPTALELAFQRGVDLTRLQGSGVDGRIMKSDVEAAPAAMRAGTRVPLSAMRRIVAERMTLSKTTIPHFTLTAEVDMTALVARRTQICNEVRKVSFNDLIIRALALAFQQVPEMNLAWGGDALIQRGDVNVGLAVAIDGGLVVPVVRGCDRKDLLGIADATAELIEKARNKRLTPEEYEGGCITISNLGMFGIDTVAPIINPGEVAILGVGRIAPKPVIINDGFTIRQMTTLTLACDHRVVDGAIGAQFLGALKEALEAPDTLT